MTRPEPTRLLSVAHVAKQIGTGSTFVYDEIATGRLPVIQLGRGDRNKYRIAETDLTEWIEQHRQKVGSIRLSRRAS